MKVLFFGSDHFASEALETLLEGNHEVAAVVGKPDSPSGRGLKSAPTPVVVKARELSLPLLQPSNINGKEFLSALEDLEWNVGVVVAYGELIPAWLIEIPEYHFVNLHPSLLPRYRGASPIEYAIMEGASITGVTTIEMNERIDAGDIYCHYEVPIYDEDTSGTLRERLARLGGRLLVETLYGIESGRLISRTQDEKKATYAPPVTGKTGSIDWGQPAEKIERITRALNPEPGAYTYFRGKRIKIWLARVTDVPQEDEPGTLENMGKEGFLVNTGTTCLQILSLQPEGKSKMGAAEFSRGQRIVTGETFTGEP